MSKTVLVMLLLSGCVAREPASTVVAPDQGQVESLRSYIVVDPDTGCQYLGYIGHGLTPRLDSAGKPMCGRKAK